MKNSIDFYEIYDYHYQPLWQRSYFKIILLFLILFILLLGSYFLVRYFLRKRRAKKLLPWEIALMELEKLSIKHCETKSDFKRFYFQLTLIIKKYLSKRYDWDTQDKTDEELIVYLQNKNFDSSLLSGLKKLAEGALWIKFANEHALKIQAEKDLQTAHYIIEKTRGNDEISKT